jgi:hypothetical protein
VAFPEDRVLVGVMPNPQDFEIARQEAWYRVPYKHALKGIHAEFIAFYFTSKFSEDLRWGVHYFARRTGHELVRRIDLFPDQPNHPRAQEHYYKLQLSMLRQKDPPILSARWRRITFIQTTWDRFVNAREINDLFVTGDEFVDRVYHALKARGILADRQVAIREGSEQYTVDLVVPCQDGAVYISGGNERPKRSLSLLRDEAQDLDRIDQAIRKHGGPIMVDLPL